MMELSTRSQFKAKVVPVTTGRTTSHVQMDSSGTIVHTSITSEAIDDLIRGHDSYAVAVASGKLNPHLEGKQVLLAHAQDDRPLPAPRSVVPGDSHAVRDLVTVEIR